MQTPLYIACGVLLQYTVMPGLGAVIAHFCGLPKAFAVGCAPAGRSERTPMPYGICTRHDPRV